MNQQLLNHVEKAHLKNSPEIKPGQTVRVHQRIKEGSKERVQVFEGLVIQTGGGSGINKTFTVRKVVSGVGVEKVFPLHSNNIVKIEIVKKGKIRRAKLYFMRERSGKSARLKEVHINETTEIEPLHKDEPVQEEATEENNETAETAEATETPETAEAPAQEEAPAEEKAQEPKEEPAEETPAEEAKEEDKEEA